MKTRARWRSSPARRLGIGLACADRLLNDGYRPAFCDIDFATARAQARRLDPDSERTPAIEVGDRAFPHY